MDVENQRPSDEHIGSKEMTPWKTTFLFEQLGGSPVPRDVFVRGVLEQEPGHPGRPCSAAMLVRV